MGFQMEKTKYDWQFYTEPNNYSSFALNGERVYWPRGKLLGGTSQINAMIYMRGNRQDYDTWEQMGNPGWNYDFVLEYFKRSEDNTEKKYAEDKHYHATGGLLKVGSFGSNDANKALFKKGFKEIGLKEVKISNSNEFLGYFDAQGTVDGGERCGTAKAFLASAKKRKNLHVIKNALVTTLKFDAQGSVNGVNFRLGDSEFSANSKKEVVLSAGVVGSPQLLMLSGIGPRAELQKHNIFLRKDLPVGLNLQDHIVIPLLMSFDRFNSTEYTPQYYADQMYQYSIHRKGDLTNIGGADLMLYASTVNDPNFPDVQINPLDFDRQQNGLPFILKMFNINDGFIKSLNKLNEKVKVTVWCVILLNPKSRGHIGLASKSPFEKPKIYPNYLYEKEDVDVLVNGIKMVTKLTTTKAFIAQGAQVVNAYLPPCDKFSFQSDLYWQCFVRQLTTSGYHHAGTCKMGPLNDSTTVVDSMLRVKGVKGLRVVDASIMPKLVSGNTNAPTIMIGEMGADFIKYDWWKD